MNAETKRSTSFWTGFGKESRDLEALRPTVRNLYGLGPWHGGKSKSEIANLLGISVSDVKKLLKPCRQTPQTSPKRSI
jgi:hypothetical protein